MTLFGEPSNRTIIPAIQTMKRAIRTFSPLLPRSTTQITRLHHQRTMKSPPCRLPAFSTTFPGSFGPYSTQHNPQSSSTSAKACPSCGSPLALREISCVKCGALSPLPENINYLSLFGISAEQPFKFDIDVGKLKKEYLKLMSKVHPDSVINESDVCPRLDGALNIILFSFHFHFSLSPPR
jgi:hypothetical protein